MSFPNGCNCRLSMMGLPTSRILLDSSANGSLRIKTPAEALKLIELVANNQYMNFSERGTVKKGVMEVETVNALMTQLGTINKKLEKLEVAAVSTQNSCGLCGGPHENHNCLHTMIPTPTLTIPVGGITPTSVGEAIKDSKGNGIITTLKDNPHSLHLNLLQSNRIILKKS
ncbi:hypothetical protein PIB30_047729 [Stylosanthes scabra]|uniref:Uncharacterized protein n=1 Tax=Stylosanthes scabra TaxID=79078 RepID=A0ABU6WGR1_9FABA|nr:hypothetical protein [Stylosanthes scabra]